MGNNQNLASNCKKFPKLYAFWALILEYVNDYFSGQKYKHLYEKDKTK